MVSRSFKFLLLASLVFWTSGAAQYLHEMMEHGGNLDAGTAGHVTVATGQPASSPQDKKSGDKDHDDCPTCQLLAHMKADRVPPAAPLVVQLCSFSTVFLPDRRPPIATVLPSAPIRGPPATA